VSWTVADQDDQVAHPRNTGAALLLGAMGIVYGNIGTSLIHTRRENFEAASIGAAAASAAAQAAVPGVLHMVLWTVLVVATSKYVVLATRADNDGEGGIIALIF